MREGTYSQLLRRSGAALCLLLLAAVARAGGGDTPGEWIMRMNMALARNNYEGLLAHQIGPHRSVLRIVHRVQDGHMNERITVIFPVGPGPGREFTRRDSEWVEYDPGQRVARVQTRNRSYGFLTALNGFNEQTQRNYAITDEGTEALQGWMARRVALLPRDGLRYGYRFWLDARTALPLKAQLVSNSGEVIEEVSFLSLSLPEHIDDAQLKPGFDTAGFRWVSGDTPMYTPGLVNPPVPRNELLPPGFRVRLFTRPEDEAKAPGPRTRFIVSDGIDWVTVWVEKRQPVPGQTPGQSQSLGDVMGPKDRMSAMPGARPDGVVVMGSSAAYMALLDGFKVTVVGEVPPPTVKAIAEAVRAE